MNLHITAEHVINMAKLAIIASRPVGMGYLHYDSNLKENDIHFDAKEVEAEGRLSIDYYEGRMVKFSGRLDTDGSWYFNDSISADYQSWKSSYDNYEILALAAEKK